MSLGTLTGLKLLLSKSLTDTSIDPLLQGCLDAADRVARTYCKRPGLVSPPVTYTGLIMNGTGRDTILLPHRPVVSLASVYQDLTAYGGDNPVSAFAATTLLTAGVDYMLEHDDSTGTYSSASGIIRRLKSSNLLAMSGIVPSIPYGTLTTGPAGPRWARVYGSIKVTFTAGYVAGGVPADLQMAVNEIAAWIKRAGPFGGLPMQSENLGEYGYTLGVHALQGAPELGSARQILSAHRERFLEVW